MQSEESAIDQFVYFERLKTTCIWKEISNILHICYTGEAKAKTPVKKKDLEKNVFKDFAETSK